MLIDSLYGFSRLWMTAILALFGVITESFVNECERYYRVHSESAIFEMLMFLIKDIENVSGIWSLKLNESSYSYVIFQLCR